MPMHIGSTVPKCVSQTLKDFKIKNLIINLINHTNYIFGHPQVPKLCDQHVILLLPAFFFMLNQRSEKWWDSWQIWLRTCTHSDIRIAINGEPSSTENIWLTRYSYGLTCNTYALCNEANAVFSMVNVLIFLHMKSSSSCRFSMPIRHEQRSNWLHLAGIYLASSMDALSLVIKQCQHSAQKLALLYSFYVISCKLFLRKLELDI